jgi:hypothetical protein
MEMTDRADLDAEAIGEGMAELGDELASHFGVLADLFTDWRSPETVRAVVDSMISGDREAFQSLTRFDASQNPLPDPLDPPDGDIPWVPDFCAIVVDVVEKLIPKKNVYCCRLRTDLTPDEKRTYFMIVFWASKTGNLAPIDSEDGFSEVGAPGPVIPEGAFLDQLKAAGLVKCGRYCWVDGGLRSQLTPPEHICAKP